MKRLLITGSILLLWMVTCLGCAVTQPIEPDAYMPHLLGGQDGVLAAQDVSADELVEMSTRNTFRVPNDVDVLGETATLMLSIGEHDGQADRLLAYHIQKVFEGGDGLDKAFTMQ